MTDIQSTNIIDDVPEIDEELQQILGHSLDRAKDMLESSGFLIPFTAVLVKDQVLSEQHPGDNPEECFAMARHAVEGMRGAIGYAFCYDGFIDTNQGMKDAIIAEGGLAGEENGVALAYMYSSTGTDDEGNLVDVEVVATPTYIGEAQNFMCDLKEITEHPDAEDAADFEPEN